MEKFTKLTAKAAPLLRNNIDTDVIITVERLMTLSRAEMGAFAFEVWRFLPDGSENPAFELNLAGFKGAEILIAGRNFGCGSSREMAVWALAGMGLRCIIAPSFGDIFANNCTKNGLLAIVLPESVVDDMAVQAEKVAGSQPFTIDLETSTIILPSGEVVSFVVPPGDRKALLSGLDEIGRTLLLEDDIAAFQSRDRLQRPWVYGVGT